VNHLHFTTPDLAATAQWYQKFLGLTANPAPVLIYAFFLDDVMFFFEPIGARADYQATDNQVLNHVAFSVSDLDGWLKRARDQNIEILSEPALVNGFKSFFMRGPDGMLLEVVQAAPSKELCLNNSPTIPPSILSPSAGSAGGPP
jgi:catechol 2,3-dioxygenase-like lactoylglutathione lyase family enzyme